MILRLSFLLCFAFSAHALTLAELDRRQETLALAHEELLRRTPSYLELAELADDEAQHARVRQHVQDIDAFFRSYDAFNLQKIDFFFDQALASAQDLAREHLATRGSLPRTLARRLRELEELRASYAELKVHFGTEEDMERLKVGQDVLHAYGSFVNELKKLRGTKITRNFGSARIVPFIDSPRDFLRSSDRFINLLWQSYFRARTGIKDHAPIPEALQSTQQRLVRMRRVETRWDGLEHLGDLSHDGKTLNMFLINHANSFFDTSAQQAFPVKGLSVMGNVDVFFPPFLARRMVRSDHMITVGHGDTTGKAIELVRRRQLNKFFLAIEGITGVGLYEMRPVMPLFNSAVYEAIERGLELKLYPISFPENFRLLNDWRAPVEGKIPARGVLQPPLGTEHCLALKRATGREESIGLLMRWAWFATLNTSEQEWLSMPYPSEIQRRLDLMFWGNHET